MRYIFSSFLLDTETRTLHCHDELVQCDERMILLMSLLITHYPDHCDQALLLEKLWPNTIVSNWSVARLISDTRKHFCKLGLTYPAIQTLHGRGYRLAHDLATHLVIQPETMADLQPDRAASPIATTASELATETSSATSNQDDNPVNVHPCHTDNAQQPVTNSSIIPPNTAPSNASPLRHRDLVSHSPLWLLASGLGLIVITYMMTLFESPPENKLIIGEAHDVKARILWVDDHPENNQAERNYLIHQGIGVYTTTSTEDALTLLSLYRYDALITDMGRGEEPLAGLKFITAVRQTSVTTPIYLYTIMPSDALQQKALDFGAQGVAVEAQALYELLQPLLE